MLYTIESFAKSNLTYRIEIGSKWNAFRRKQIQKTQVFAIYFVFDLFMFQFSITMPKEPNLNIKYLYFSFDFAISLKILKLKLLLANQPYSGSWLDYVAAELKSWGTLNLTNIIDLRPDPF